MKLRLWHYYSISVLILHMAGAAPNPAHFKPGADVSVVSTQVGPKGAVLQAGKSGTPIDGISVEIPPGALPKDTAVTLGYNTGKLTVPSGDASGVFVRLTAGTLLEFQEPIKIHFSYDAARWKGRVLVGYAIDDKGQLSPVDSGAKDGKAGEATFITMVPLLFTWVYAPVR